MTPEAKDFMSKNPPKYKLKKFSDDIASFLKEGYTQAKILRYLQEYHDLKVSRATLTRQIAYIKQTSKSVKTENLVRTEPKKSSESENNAARASYALPKKMNASEFAETVRKQFQAKEE